MLGGKQSWTWSTDEMWCRAGCEALARRYSDHGTAHAVGGNRIWRAVIGNEARESEAVKVCRIYRPTRPKRDAAEIPADGLAKFHEPGHGKTDAQLISESMTVERGSDEREQSEIQYSEEREDRCYECKGRHTIQHRRDRDILAIARRLVSGCVGVSRESLRNRRRQGVRSRWQACGIPMLRGDNGGASNIHPTRLATEL